MDELYEYHEVRWGITPCRGQWVCQQMADLLFDGQPLCIDCADILWQRIHAIGLNPELRNQLPDLWDVALP